MAESNKNSLASTIGAFATLITAIGGLIVILNQSGFFDKTENSMVAADSGALEIVTTEAKTIVAEPEINIPDAEEMAREDSLDEAFIRITEILCQINNLMIDKEIRLDYVRPLPDYSFQLQCTLVNADKATHGQNFEKELDLLRKFWVKKIKSLPKFEIPEPNDSKLLYSYFDKNGDFLMKDTLKLDFFTE